jgi:uncharacterized repeat protein (TIGR01451 family)
MRRTAGFLSAVCVAGSLVWVTATPSFADATLSSSGPLSDITTTSDLNCSVDEVGDTQGEWFGATACATLLALGSKTYGPASIPAGQSTTAWHPVSQTDVTGTGTEADPLTVTTVVRAGNTGLTLSQTDSYVVGAQSYQTDMTVMNNGTAAQNFKLFRAGDCFFSNSDTGFGRVDNGTSPACVAPSLDDPSVPGPRIESFIPLTSGSSYQVSFYSDVWTRSITNHAGFKNTCLCDASDGSYDNGMGLSWPVSLAAGASTTISAETYFSPPPLHAKMTADDPAVIPGASDGYTVTVQNPTAVDISADALTATLPTGFSYVPGSTTGATTADPSVSDSTLTWSGPFDIPAGGGKATLHYGVTVSSTKGNYPATDTAVITTPPDETVAPGTATIAVAPVQVKSVSPGAIAVGASAKLTIKGTTFHTGGTLTISGDGLTISDLKVKSPTTATATVAVDPAATPGARDVTFTDGTGHSGTCTGCLNIHPQPTLTGVTPSAVGQGAHGVVLVLNGTGFVKKAAVSIDDGITVTSLTWVSATELDAKVTVPGSATVGSATVTVDNGDGGVATTMLTVDPKPKASSATPPVPHGTSQDVTVTGTNFVAGLTVSTTAKGITFGTPQSVTPTSFVVTVTVASTKPAGKFALVVTNPDGGTSSANLIQVT